LGSHYCVSILTLALTFTLIYLQGHGVFIQATVGVLLLTSNLTFRVGQITLIKGMNDLIRLTEEAIQTILFSGVDAPYAGPGGFNDPDMVLHSHYFSDKLTHI
jgi:hypothetical protein